MEKIPSWDVFIGLFLLLGIGYGFILKREKVITILCSTYIGIVLSSNFTQYVFDFFQGNKVVANQIWIKSNVSASTIAIALLLITMFFVSGAINASSTSSGDLSPIEVIVYCGLITALVISTILGFLPDATRETIVAGSRAGSILYSLKTLWVIAPPITLVIFNFRRR